MGVDVGGDGDVGVAEELLHGDQGDAGLDEQGRVAAALVAEEPARAQTLAAA